MAEPVYEVTDDSGFLALVDPDSYETFVASDWTLEHLFAHFKSQMRDKRLLIWGTGMEKTWRVRVARSAGEVEGFREVSGPIVASGSRLLLTNYESLTMAAQFDDQELPQPYERDQVLEVLPGEYRCRVIQAIGPDDYELPPDPIADFVLELVECDEPLTPWMEVPWAEI